MPTKKPDGYQSTYDDQIKDIANRIVNREDFSYDVNGDALYQQYKDMYTQQGKQAMMDTMGQAQAMTGGYSNSYAQSVGQQAYQGHLQQLNGVIPELYQLALDTYNRKGDAMYDQFSMLGTLEDQDYGRYRDQMDDYFTDRAYDYQIQRDQVADEQWQKEFDEAKRQYDQSYALSVSKSSGSGSSRSSGGSGKSSSGSSGSSDASANSASIAQPAAAGAINGMNQNFKSVQNDLNNYIASGASKSEINNYLRNAYQSGYITQAQYIALKEQYAPSGYSY